MGPNATLMIHEIRGGFWGKNIEIQNDAKEFARINKIIFGMLDKNTGQKSGHWWNQMKQHSHTDFFLNAKKAKTTGLATHIGIPYVETKVDIVRTLKL